MSMYIYKVFILYFITILSFICILDGPNLTIFIIYIEVLLSILYRLTRYSVWKYIKLSFSSGNSFIEFCSTFRAPLSLSQLVSNVTLLLSLTFCNRFLSFLVIYWGVST